MMMKIILYYVFIATFVVTVFASGIPEVNITSGGIRGRVVETDNGPILQFFEIPYAEPPTGSLRFTKPLPVKSWEGFIDGTEPRTSCVQEFFPTRLDSYTKFQLTQKGDCLKLAVYVPRAINTTHPRSVMVWIHGGGYVSGDGMGYDASDLALIGDVIVVTVNYRLGVFGFLSTFDDVIPGNFGLWDQRLALQWVQDNIKFFGGDSTSVTLFGESAGGFSASFHATKPENSGLFQRVIIQSGAINKRTSIYRGGKNAALKVGISTQCLDNSTTVDTIDSQTLLDCLQNVSVDFMRKAEAEVSLTRGLSFSVDFTPVIDGELIKHDPVVSLSNDSSEEVAFWRSLDVIVGTTDFEGGVFSFLLETILGSMQLDPTLGLPKNIACDDLYPVMAEEFYGNSSIAPILCEDKTSDDKIQTALNFLKATTDVYYVAPAFKLLEAHSKGQPASSAYQYVFTYELPDGWFFKPLQWLKGQGSQHFSDVSVMFRFHYYTQNITDLLGNDTIARNTMIKYWTSFAKSGDPNIDGAYNHTWPKYTPQEKKYLEIGTDGPQTGSAFHAGQIEYLTQTLLSKLNEKDRGPSDGAKRTFETNIFILIVCFSYFSHFVKAFV